MAVVFKDAPSVLTRTQEIAERCNLKLAKVDNPFPEFAVPDGHTIDSYFEEVCRTGFKKRLDTAVHTLEMRGTLRHQAHEYQSRLDYEIDVIKQMKYSGYFLIVWDFIKYARDHEIPVGPGRGSAVGSVVSYCLKITDLDPLKFNLFFERFLNPDRISMPDIDTDFCVDRRDEVIAYVTEKYGKDRVAQIVTFGTMAARAAICDAGRALGVPLPDVDKVAKMIPSGPGGLSIEQALEQIPELKMASAGSPQIRKLLDTAKDIEGLARNAGTHAAGVVISAGPLIDYAPLVKFNDGGVNTQFDMIWVEKIGLLKMDFLGLRNLTVMNRAVGEIRRTVDGSFDLAKIADDDKRTYHMLSRGETMGVFQFESDGMKRVCTELKPSRFEDVIALVALYRPGPMEWIPQYISNKHGRTKVKYLHPKLEPILAETYGVAVYQESVMQIARDIAGFSMGEADELRKVMGKKQKEKIPEYRKKFVDGALATSGISRDLADKIFAFIEPFAGYGFNKSHAAAYGWIAYQTAYLKANHPLQYLTALMTSVKDKTDKLVEYIDEAKKTGITVLPPDINESLTDFAVVGDRIRFGLAAVKGVGEGAVRSIIDTRETDGKFTDLFDLAKRVDSKQVNRRVFEALIKCGALDELTGNRAQNLAALDVALDLAAHATREKELGQVSLFGDASEHAPSLTPVLPIIAAPSTREMLAWEKETLGIFVSGHPLSDLQDLLVRGGAMPIKNLREVDDDAFVTIAGMVTSVRRTLTKSGQQMLIAQLEDTSGACDVVVFSKMYPQVQGLFSEDEILVVKGRLRLRERPGAAPGEEGPLELSISANDVNVFEIPVARASAPAATAVREWHVDVGSRDQIDRLAALVDDWPGGVPVTMHARGRSQRLARTIAADHRLRGELERIFGRGNVRHDA
jgi:DNA polymerase-3 subunit alpha